MFLLAIAVTLTAWSCNHIWRLTYAEYVKDGYARLAAASDAIVEAKYNSRAGNLTPEEIEDFRWED